MTGLLRDQRGGVENVLYVIMIAGIAMAALPGVRGFADSAEASFRDSTTRFDKPGTYVGGSVEYGPRRDREWISGLLPDARGEWEYIRVNENEVDCTHTDASGELIEQYRRWREDNSIGDQTTDWYYYWCRQGLGMRDGEECTVDVANRNWNWSIGRTLSNRGCFERRPPDEWSDFGSSSEGYGWKNIACFYLVHSHEYFACSPWGQPGLPPIGGAPFPTCTGLPVFNPSRRYCSGASI